MIWISIALGLLGVLLIYFEFFLPGGVVGALGGVLMIGGVLFMFLHHTDIVYTLVYVVALVILTIVAIRMALWRIRASKNAMWLGASSDQEGYRASSFERELLGKTGIVISTLRPSGHIQIGDEQYQAVAQSSYIDKGEKVKVIGGEGARLIVKKES